MKSVMNRPGHRPTAIKHARLLLAVTALAVAGVVGAAEPGEDSDSFGAFLKELLKDQTAQSETAATEHPAQTEHSGFIPCPLEELRTEVVSELPQGWWQTPQIGRLEGTYVQRIGGKNTLVCAYRAYGATASVMRLPPEGRPGCQAVENGFYCD